MNPARTLSCGVLSIRTAVPHQQNDGALGNPARYPASMSPIEKPC
jgi:hypothetical protein